MGLSFLRCLLRKLGIRLLMRQVSREVDRLRLAREMSVTVLYIHTVGGAV